MAEHCDYATLDARTLIALAAYYARLLWLTKSGARRGMCRRRIAAIERAILAAGERQGGAARAAGGK